MLRRQRWSGTAALPVDADGGSEAGTGGGLAVCPGTLALAVFPVERATCRECRAAGEADLGADMAGAATAGADSVRFATVSSRD
jgi:hypothetical protein